MPAVRYSARDITALTTNPSCPRRGRVDAAGVDKSQLAQRLGFPARFGRSRFAITRGNAFEARVRADGARELLTVVGLEGAEIVEIELTLDIAGQQAIVDAGPILLRVATRLHVVAVKSFAVIDGQADRGKVSAVAQEAAVHVLALRGLGHDVAHEVILVCPRDFSNRPTAHRIDIRRHVDVLARQLARLPHAEKLDEPDEISVSQIPAHYAPECLAACELARYCRHEARTHGKTDALGRSVRDALGGIATGQEVLSLAAGGTSTEYAEIAELLVTARALRAEVSA